MKTTLIRYGVITALGLSIMTYLYMTYTIIPVSTINGLNDKIETLENKVTKFKNSITILNNKNLKDMANCINSRSQDMINNTLRRIHEVPKNIPDVNTTGPITIYY